MISKRKEKTVITDRDKNLFKYLFVNKVAAVEDIALDIFGNISTKTVHRRLMKLSVMGLIEAQAQRQRGNRMIYSLTKKGFRGYISENNILKRVQLKSDSLEHDLALLKIKRRFKKLEMVKGYYSENLIRSGLMDHIGEIKPLKELHPDGIVKVKMGDKEFYLPLEYEASSKYSKRNEKLLAKYYTNPNVAGVLFISKNEQIKRRIYQKELAKNYKTSGKFYYSLFDNVFEQKEKINFTNIKKEEIEFR